MNEADRGLVWGQTSIIIYVNTSFVIVPHDFILPTDSSGSPVVVKESD